MRVRAQEVTSAEPTGPGRSDRGIRVLVVTNMYPTPAEPDFGCFVRDQVDDLRRLGVDVTVLAFDGRSHRRRYLAATPRLRRALRRDRYDVVHAHYGLSGALASLQFTTPVVTTFHGSDAWVPWERKVSWLVARRTQPIAVAWVVAANLGVHDAPVIPCAVDLDAFTPVDRAEARRTLGWPIAGPCVLFPAARHDRSKATNKRVDVFDAMIDRLRPSAPDVFAASLDGLPREAVALAMNAADVAVVTSLWEGAPVVVKEALACQTPVVSVAVGDVPAVVDGLPGCAIVPRDPEALAKAVGEALDVDRNPRLRESMQAYGRQPIAERVLRVYGRVLARRPPR
ncbi:MAG: glycosyltransferase [Actinomycetota bacterium]|nr:glycosyltransferase [Actinomycetota bacterium]